MNPICLLVNLALVMLYRKNARKFQKGLPFADQVQDEQLIKILRANENTVYGKKYHFSSIHSAEEFQKKVPSVTYEDLLPFLKRMQEGEEGVLTAEQIRLFEPTSGSSSASKLIPYTDGLKSEFQEAIQPWIYDLYTRHPGIMKGKSYWSITPAASKKQYTKAGIPIGFEEDMEYFGKLEQLLMNLIFVKPKADSQECDMDMFYYNTCLELLKAHDLSLISVWNPTYLLLLLDFMKDRSGDLLKALAPWRRRTVEQALKTGRFDSIWPHLTVISCWCDAAASGYRSTLEELFPHTAIQPKGLLATEAFMTIPWRGADGGVAGIYSHFFEFCNTSTGLFSRYSKLTRDTTYEILLTTMGGLYRYRIGDIVKVTGYDTESGMPVLRFVGRDNKVSDLFGEKLSERFVQDILNTYIPPDRFCLLAPEGRRYVLYLEQPAGEGALHCRHSQSPDRNSLAGTIEQKLCQNFHYAYCRRLGQLKPLQIRFISGHPRKDYLEACVRHGQKLGDIKPSLLSTRQGWKNIFTMEDE